MTLGDCQAGGKIGIPGVVSSFVGVLGLRKQQLESGLKRSLGADTCSPSDSLHASVLQETHLSIGHRGHGR